MILYAKIKKYNLKKKNNKNLNKCMGIKLIIKNSKILKIKIHTFLNNLKKI